MTRKIRGSNDFRSTTRLRRYEIRSLLGAGGMGEVYLTQLFVLVVKRNSLPVLKCCTMRWSGAGESNFTSGKV